jgi:hypothetical protein
VVQKAGRETEAWETEASEVGRAVVVKERSALEERGWAAVMV